MWHIALLPTPGDPPPGRRVARLLKLAGGLGLRCVGVYGVPPVLSAVNLVEGEA